MNLKFIFIMMLLGFFPLLALTQDDPLIANVYEDEYVSVRAGIIEMENRIINFGDVVPLVVEIDFVSTAVRLEDIGPEFFSLAWPEEMGAFLLDAEIISRSTSAGTNSTSTNIFRFQVLACPDGKVLCKGSRFYDLPEFTLEYFIIDDAGNETAAEPVTFQPWPVNLMIASAIPLGQEGELNSFATYFPTGAYPNPLTGQDLRQSFGGLIAGGLIFLLGGILMSPFSFFKQKAFAARTKSRWENVLDTLKSGEIQDEKEFLDVLRKCLVWYCVDELKVDPFYWLKHEEEVMHDDHKGTGDLASYRDLFMEVLHSPSGQNDVLLEKLADLAVKRA